MSIADHMPDRGVIRNSEVDRITDSDGCAALTVQAMASGTVFGIEHSEVTDCVRPDHLRIR
jgi:hypothetical protein